MTIQTTPYTSFGYDPTTQLYLPFKVGPRQTDPVNNEEYALLRTGGDFQEIAGQPAGNVTGTTTDLFPSIDMSAYSFAILQLSGIWTMTLQAQWSNDNVNFVAGETGPIGAVGASTLITVNGMYILPKYGRYLRVRPSVFTSNASCVGLLECYTQISPEVLTTIFAIQSGTWTVQPGNTVNTSPWLVARNNNNFVQAAGGGLTIGKASPGWLDSGMITAAGTVGLTVYDNAAAAAGTPLLVIPANPTVGTRFPVEGWAKNGIASGGVANCPGVTFFYA